MRDRRTDGWTDTPSYRDAQTHLKKKPFDISFVKMYTSKLELVDIKARFSGPRSTGL